MAKKKVRSAAKKAAPQPQEAAAPEAPRGTKAQAIRDTLKATPKASPSFIAADLSAKGYTVTPQEVSNIKFQLKAKRRKKRAAAKAVAAAAEPASTAAAADDLISMAALQAAKKLASELGGVEKARQAINSLARLVD